MYIDHSMTQTILLSGRGPEKSDMFIHLNLFASNLFDRLIYLTVFYAVSAILQLYNGELITTKLTILVVNNGR